MTTFQKVKLGDVVDVIPGFAFKSSDFSDSGKPIIKIKNIQSDFSISLENCDYVKDEVFEKKNFDKYKIAPKEALIAMTGATIGKVGRFMIETDIYLNQRVALFRSKKINNDYLWALLRSPKYQDILKGLGSGAAQANMSSFQIEKIEIDLPDIPTQTHIASVLSAYDDLIENNEKRIKILEEMAQLLYTEWFVKFNFPGHEKVKMVDSGTEYGMIPEGWKIGSISHLANVISGFPFKGSTYQDIGKYKIVTIKNVHDGKFVLNFDSFIDKLPSKLPSTCILKNGDILLSLTGNVGRVCIVYGLDHVLNQRVAKLEPVNKNNREFIYLLFRQKRFQQKMEAMSNGAAQLNLSPIQVKDIKIIIPNSAILDEFSRLVGKYFDILISLQEENQNLSKTRDLLIPQLVTGKWELKTYV
jgi:type I restriction enzyme S subunit